MAVGNSQHLAHDARHDGSRTIGRCWQLAGIKMAGERERGAPNAGVRG